MDDAVCRITADERKAALEGINEKNVTDIDALILNEQTQEVSNLVAGYVARKIKPITDTCCNDLLTGECKDDNYLYVTIFMALCH